MTSPLSSFVYAWHGLKAVWREEQNFRTEILCGLAVFLFAFCFQFSFIEWACIIFGVTLVLIAEIVNTAIEDICNKIEPNRDDVIGKIKDTMAAYVLLNSIGVALVGLIVFYHHFFLNL